MKDRYWQCIRGIAILIVILMHCQNGLDYVGLQQHLWFAERAIINFPVAVFLFMSGYFIKFDEVGTSEKGKYYIKRLKKLGVPYLLWSAIYIGIDILAGCVSGNKDSIREYVVDIITGGAAPQLYYILVLVELTLLTPFLVAAMEKKYFGRWTDVVFLSISPIYSLFISIYVLFNYAPPQYFGVWFVPWISFYYFGMVHKRRKGSSLMPKASKLVICLLFLVICQFLSVHLLKENGIDLGWLVSQNRFLSTVYAYIVIIFCCYLENKNKSTNVLSNYLVKLGDLSYGIFYVHYIYVYL